MGDQGIWVWSPSPRLNLYEKGQWLCLSLLICKVHQVGLGCASALITLVIIGDPGTPQEEGNQMPGLGRDCTR